jgi:energy-converting hydrogenase Eha subunit G
MCAAVIRNEVLVALAMLAQCRPRSALTCHWTVGAGLPDAVALNVATDLCPALTLRGEVVTLGAVSTVSVIALLVTVPDRLVNRNRYRLPLSS